jgi:glucoamylase
VGTSASPRRRVRFTISHGILDEIYFPVIDQPNTRDFGLLVADGREFFSEEKRDARHDITPIADGVPGYQLTNTCNQGRYRIHKTIITHPQRDVLLQSIRFEALSGSLKDYSVYALLAPHIEDCGYGNNGWASTYKGASMLFANRGQTTLALACSSGFKGMSCGYVGYIDGWQDISSHKRMTWFFDAAPNGNIALTGEVLVPPSGQFVLALGFGRDAEEAGQQALSALIEPLEDTINSYAQEWKDYQSKLEPLDNSSHGINY